MSETTLIKNTDIELLALKYKKEMEEIGESELNIERKNIIARQICTSFKFLVDLGKPQIMPMEIKEFDLAQAEIKKRAEDEIERLKKELNGLYFFNFGMKINLRKDVRVNEFVADKGYSRFLHSQGIEDIEKYFWRQIPPNFKDLLEKILTLRHGKKRHVYG